MVPATVEIEVRDSTIEKAAQMNLEGSILNLPPSDPGRAHEGLVSIDVEGSVIRDAGSGDGFRGETQNIWLAPSILAKGPFARGRYRLAVRDSIVEKALKGGITVGNAGSDFKIAPDAGDYEIRLNGNTIRDNGTSVIAIAAARAKSMPGEISGELHPGSPTAASYCSTVCNGHSSMLQSHSRDQRGT